jgi:hypothetical protein
MTTRTEYDALAASYKAQHAQMGLTKETTVEAKQPEHRPDMRTTRPDVLPGTRVVWIDANGWLREGEAVRTWYDEKARTRRVMVRDAEGHSSDPHLDRVGVREGANAAG